MKRSHLANGDCPVGRTLNAIGDCWSLMIIRDAFLGRRRFGEFQKSLTVAKNILTTRLRALVEQGVLSIGPASDGSAYQEYVLTEKGRELYVVTTALRQWGEKHLYPGERTKFTLVDREKEVAIGPIELRTLDGRIVGASDLKLVKAGSRKTG
jgi:DNA-binding HxlR family transcriptional regulator